MLQAEMVGKKGPPAAVDKNEINESLRLIEETLKAVKCIDMKLLPGSENNQD